MENFLDPVITPIVTLIIIFMFVLLPCCALMSYLGRKIGADLQARVGPNRTGPAGAFQPVADLLKALQKEDVAVSSPLFNQISLALWIGLLLSTVTILPLSSALLLVDADMSTFLVLWAALAVAMICLFIGFHSGTVPAWISAVRMAFQAVTGAFPALLAMLCVGIQAGGFRWSMILAAQGSSPLSWMIFSSPFAPLAFIVFEIAGLILFTAPPMDSGISSAEIAGGLSSLWVGRNLSLFNFARFYGFFLWSCMAVSLFLGGWLLPPAIQEGLGDSPARTVLETLTLLLKCFTLMLIVSGVTRVNPRTRADQITGFSWKVLSPVALFALIGSALWRMWWA